GLRHHRRRRHGKSHGDGDRGLPPAMAAQGAMPGEWDSAHHPGGHGRWITADDFLPARDSDGASEQGAIIEPTVIITHPVAKYATRVGHPGALDAPTLHGEPSC